MPYFTQYINCYTLYTSLFDQRYTCIHNLKAPLTTPPPPPPPTHTHTSLLDHVSCCSQICHLYHEGRFNTALATQNVGNGHHYSPYQSMVQLFHQPLSFLEALQVNACVSK